jgi:hypothetical protein
MIGDHRPQVLRLIHSALGGSAGALRKTGIATCILIGLLLAARPGWTEEPSAPNPSCLDDRTRLGELESIDESIASLYPGSDRMSSRPGTLSQEEQAAKDVRDNLTSAQLYVSRRAQILYLIAAIARIGDLEIESSIPPQPAAGGSGPGGERPHKALGLAKHRMVVLTQCLVRELR